MGTSKKVVSFITSTVCAVLLAGCGGGGGGGSVSVAAPSLSGLAATGAGIANAAVTAKCATGTPLTGTTDANGSFNLVLGGRTLPCMLQVTGGTPAVTLHSFAQAVGRVNITPVTDLIVSKALLSDPATAFAGYTPTNGSTVEAGLAAAKTYVASELGAITGSSIANPLTGSFSVGDADDRILDALANALGNASKTVADLRVVAQAGGTMTGTVPAFLATPANLVATANSASQITVGWTAVPGASSYKVYRASSTGAVNVGGSEIGTATTNSYVDSGLTASNAYFYKVVAFNSVVPSGSAASAEATATTSASSGGGGLTCDTSLFQSSAPVRTPTSGELATFARNYSGSEGDYGPNPGDPFVATGSATLVFNANGTATYNGANYAMTSYCLETISGNPSTQLVIHAGAMSHFDLKTTGVWAGYTAAGKVVTEAAYSGGATPSTWTTHSIAGSGSFEDVVWDGSKFVAIGTYVGTSTDGATWTFNALLAGKGLAKSGSTLVLAGISTATGSDIRKSVNGGTSWTTPATANIFTVAGNSSMFVGIGGGFEAGMGQAMVIKSSTSGDTWTTRYTENATNGQTLIKSYKPIWNGSTWLVSAVKEDRSTNPYTYGYFVLTSTDGINWSKVTTNQQGRVVWTGSEFVMVHPAKTSKSSNGSSWTAVVTSNLNPTVIDFVGWTGSEFVAFSGGGSSVKVWTSPDAVTWTSRTTSATQPIYGGASNGSTYVAVGNQYTFTSP